MHTILSIFTAAPSMMFPEYEGNSEGRQFQKLERTKRKERLGFVGHQLWKNLC